MKKYLKAKLSRSNKEPERPSRITNETVAEHREQILAGGRKFKYPVQYSRHKLVINTIIISIVTLVVLVLVGWWQLYSVQNTSKFMYRVTQLLPIPVATVDGVGVRFSDYLKKYRSSIHFLEQQNAINVRTDDGKRQVEFYKRRELDNAIKDAYIAKVARQNKVSVSNKEVDDFIKTELDAKNVSVDAYERTVLNNFYDWSLDEYEGIVKSELLKRRVSFAIDTVARDKANRIKQAVAGGADFAELAKVESDDPSTKANGGAIGTVPVNNQDSNGVIAAALKLQPGQVSGLIEGADGYYLIKLTAKDASTVQYSLIKILLTELDKRFEAVKKNDKIQEYISVAKQQS
ncbi:peptidylprolyl isomerase [Pedobacter sp.]|nr:peptidylprolyl isomerase [Candidatus Saccharibacteria bacterium]